jgi:hypothetical protein
LKRNILFFVLIICALSFFSSCKNKNDPVWDHPPLNTTFAENFPLDSFHQLGLAGDTASQKVLFNAYRHQLTKNILKNFPCAQEKNIHFVFGSGKVKNVLSGDGKTYSGNFQNELIIIINDKCAKDTLFLACGNGMLSPISWKNMSDWGTALQCQFVVMPGDGIATFLPLLEDWGVQADELGMPIANKKGKIVDKDVYMNQLGKWWSDHLFPGDVIDLCNKEIRNKSGQKVDFERRQAETRKLIHKKKTLKKKHRKR